MKSLKNQLLDNLLPLIILLVIVIIIWGASLLVVLKVFQNWSTRASFGDSFGAISSLFSGLAFAGIIYTILLQRKELALQRQELSETREELRRTADAQEKSQLALREQIESMKITAKLNALNTLMETYKNEEEFWRINDLEKAMESRKYRENCVKEIQNIMAGIKLEDDNKLF